jgi:hypothetical protein
MYKIDNDVTMPEIHRTVMVYPHRELAVGQSFAVPFKAGAALRARTIQITKSSAQTGTPMKFATRTVVEDGHKMVRCWRTE